MSGTPTMQGDFFETGLGGVLRVSNVQTAAQSDAPIAIVDLKRFNEAKNVHAHSRKAYLNTVNLRRDRRGIILGLYQDSPARGFTDREVLERVYPGSGDLNMVRPRITELVDDGELIEDGRMKCPTTGKTVRVTRLANTIGQSPAAKGETDAK